MRRIIHYLSEGSAWISAASLFFVLIVVLGDVAGRTFLNSPLPGALEYLELGVVVLASFALVHTAGQEAHLRTELLTSLLPPAGRHNLARFGLFLAGALWALVSYRVFVEALRVIEGGEVTLTLHFPRGPFLLVASVALALWSLVSFWQAFAYDAAAVDAAQTEAEKSI